MGGGGQGAEGGAGCDAGGPSADHRRQPPPPSPGVPSCSLPRPTEHCTWYAVGISCLETRIEVDGLHPRGSPALSSSNTLAASPLCVFLPHAFAASRVGWGCSGQTVGGGASWGAWSGGEACRNHSPAPISLQTKESKVAPGQALGHSLGRTEP